MIRLNLMLLLAVMLSALVLVHTQYDSRRTYTQIDRAKSQSRKLEVEREQLEVRKRELATSARVQALAQGQLQMRPVNPAITEYVQYRGELSASASVATGAAQ